MREYILKPVVAAALAGASFVDALEVGLRIASGVAAIVVAVYAIQSYRHRIKLDKAQLKRLEDNEE